MTIVEALKNKGKEDTVGSKSLLMYAQDYKSLCFWVLSNPRTTDTQKISQLIEMLRANDWEIE
jgi:hypothetical protein